MHGQPTYPVLVAGHANRTTHSFNQPASLTLAAIACYHHPSRTLVVALPVLIIVALFIYLPVDDGPLSQSHVTRSLSLIHI